MIGELASRFRLLPAHVLVTGAAGLIGSAVLDLLTATGLTMTALLLEPADVPADRIVVGDAGDPASSRTLWTAPTR